ncbi:MAG: DEAD/DEAH box helicase [Bacteroidales bacterium]|nr:DEAD/DEAH box helicase [Bacteroidales bacterium]
MGYVDLSDDILDALDAMHFETCTPIQEQAIPVVLDGHDLMGVAQTGTGKTAAYLLPTIDLLSHSASQGKVRCVVMVPTHELAQQIDRQLQGFSYYLSISSIAIHGGNDGKEFARQQQAIKSGADILIATPGRLLAHMKMGYVDLSGVEHFILDEADRMLDMGFYDDIMQVVKHLPENRQTLMFSATMPDKIQRLANNILRDPAEVKLAVSKPGENIDQSVYIINETQKTPLLRHLFQTGPNKRVIVFASSKLKVKDLARELRRAHFNVAEIHSDLEQADRDRVMLDFRAGRVDILVATDIVARGIDIDDITMVVNYDVPHEAEDYVHRVGRTARAGAEGRAVTFVGPRERRKFADIERFLEIRVKRGELPEGMSGGDREGDEEEYAGNGRSRGGRGKRGGSGRGGHGPKTRAAKRHDKEGGASRPHSDKPQADKPQAEAAPQSAPENAPNGEGAKKSRNRWRRSRHKGHKGGDGNNGGGNAAPSAGPKGGGEKK